MGSKVATLWAAVGKGDRYRGRCSGTWCRWGPRRSGGGLPGAGPATVVVDRLPGRTIQPWAAEHDRLPDPAARDPELVELAVGVGGEFRDGTGDFRIPAGARSEEHTSELQSLMRISYAVFCLKQKN